MSLKTIGFYPMDWGLCLPLHQLQIAQDTIVVLTWISYWPLLLGSNTSSPVRWTTTQRPRDLAKFHRNQLRPQRWSWFDTSRWMGYQKGSNKTTTQNSHQAKQMLFFHSTPLSFCRRSQDSLVFCHISQYILKIATEMNFQKGFGTKSKVHITKGPQPRAEVPAFPDPWSRYRFHPGRLAKLHCPKTCFNMGSRLKILNPKVGCFTIMLTFLVLDFSPHVSSCLQFSLLDILDLLLVKSYPAVRCPASEERKEPGARQLAMLNRLKGIETQNKQVKPTYIWNKKIDRPCLSLLNMCV